VTTELSPPEEVGRLLHLLKDIDVERDLVRTRDLGEQLDFSSDRSLFIEAKDFAGKIADLPWGDLPQSRVQSVLGHVNNIDNTVKEVQSFSLKDGENPVSTKDRISRRFRSHSEGLKEEVIPLMGFLLWANGKGDGGMTRDFDQVLGELREQSGALLAETGQVVDQARAAAERAAALEQEAEQALPAIRATAAEKGVSQEADVFSKAAQRYESASKKWLGAAAILALLTIGAAFGLFWLWARDGQITDSDVLQLVLIKAAVLAVLTYGTVTAVRLYRSNSHLAVVNRHREDALRTFQTFVSGASDDNVKDKVLLAAAHAAFGQTPTGLVSEKGEGSNTLEILDGIGGNLIRRP